MRYLGSILGSAGMATILSGDQPAADVFRVLDATRAERLPTRN